MGSKAEQQSLEVKIPTFFRCPITLDVMRSPVSLCTGVTYDRSSIQRWLDSGNATCPATMQTLSSTDLVPNLTLHRLIQLWSSSNGPSISSPSDILLALRSNPNPAPHLRRLGGLFSDAGVDDFAKNSVVRSGACATALASLLSNENTSLETLEAAIRVSASILAADCFEAESKRSITSSLATDRSISALIKVLGSGFSVGSRIDAARVLDAMMQSSTALISEKLDLVIPELVWLISNGGETDPAAAEAGLSCMATAVSNVRRARLQMVQLGAVPSLARVLTEEKATAAAELALRLLEAAAGIAEGRGAICERAELYVGAIVERMMKVGMKGRESAVAVLWSICHQFRDRRAAAAAAAAERDGGGLTAKILLLMQSACSVAARRMCGDLIRIFGADNSKGVSGYDTKTTHIMPY